MKLNSTVTTLFKPMKNYGIVKIKICLQLYSTPYTVNNIGFVLIGITIKRCE